jgi:hypothetical protein
VDPLLTAGEYFPILRERGSHRLSSDPGLGVVCGFLTLLFLIRMTVNLAWLVVFGRSGVPMDLEGIESVHLLLCSAFLVAIGSLGAFRISLVVPEDSFLSLEPLYRPFMARLRFHNLTRSPLFPIVVGFLLCYAVACSSCGAARPVFRSPSSSASCSSRRKRGDAWDSRPSPPPRGGTSYPGIPLSPRPGRSKSGHGQHRGTVTLLLAGARIPWEPGSPWFLGGGAAAFLASFWLSLLIVAGRRAAHGITKTARRYGYGRRLNPNPLLTWYLRILPPRVWLLTYLFLLPFLISGGIGRGGRIGACVALALFACVSFAAAVVRMDWGAHLQWGTLSAAETVVLLLQPMAPILPFAALRSSGESYRRGHLVAADRPAKENGQRI